jgi:hypothetical protein
MSQRCCRRVDGSRRGFTGSFCSVPAKFEVDGRWYCHIHNPNNVEKRRAALHAKWDEESKRRQAQYRKQEAESAAVSFLQVIVDGFLYDPGHSDLDNEQTIHVRMKLGDYRRARQLLAVIKSPNAAKDDSKEKVRA